MGYTTPTIIQTKCIPLILDGKDIVGQSKTGSGKTAAFGLPLLNKMIEGGPVQAIILTPTRELCVQVADALRDFSKFAKISIASVYGGAGFEPQVDAIKRAQVVVGTPGRTLDHLRRNSLKLGHVNFVVLDEADKMLEMGFIEDVEEILRYTQKNRQTVLFSATMPSQITNIVNRYQKDPIKVKGDLMVDRSKLKQIYYNIRPHQKFSLLVHLLKQDPENVSLIFCGTRRESDIVAKNLKANGIKATAIHGGLTQNKRLMALDLLKKDKISALVATDVAARGLDIKNVTHVYNYDLPKTSEEYIHRIGRTARAGENGNAVTLLCERDYENFGRIESDRSLHIKKEDAPEVEKAIFNRSIPNDNRGGSRSSHQRRGSFRGGRSNGNRSGGSRPRSNSSGRIGGRGQGSPSSQNTRRGGQRYSNSGSRNSNNFGRNNSNNRN